MGKVIRIKARQSMVNYRKPASFVIRETYPLPPYSTVIGMVHNACGFTEYHPLKVSVQGRCRGITSDLFTRYSFGNTTFDASRHWMSIPDGEKGLGVFRGISHTELLCNVELILHLEPDEADFDAVFAGLEKPQIYPALGRYEDLIDLEEIKEVPIVKKEAVSTLRDIYVPLEKLQETDNTENIDGTVYRLSKEYEIEKNGIRRWKETIRARYIGAGNTLYDFWADDEGNPVALI